MRLFGNLPPKSKIGEYKQHKRILKKINKMLNATNIDGIVLSGLDYSHDKDNIINNDSSWNGEMDIVLLTSHKTVIYELKAKEITICTGTTSGKNWKFYYNSDSKKYHFQSFFDQASRQRAYLTRDYLNKFKAKYKIPEPNHFVVDSRLVLLPGSDYSKFYIKPPRNYDMGKFKENILDKIVEDDDKKFMINAYSKKTKKSGINDLVKLTPENYIILRNIIDKYQLKLKSGNWFRVLTENLIEEDFYNIEEKKEEVNLSIDSLLLIPQDLGIEEVPMELFM